MQAPQVAIIELGSQFTLLIERSLREIGYRSIILNPAHARDWLMEHRPKAVILSGGASSVYDADAAQPPSEVLTLMHNDGQQVQVLGICYGMQWLAHRLGGFVQASDGRREYGEASVSICESGSMFDGTPWRQQVWMSHGDSVLSVPEGFEIMALSESGSIAAMKRGHLWGVQFHPEVTHTTHGKVLLENFMLSASAVKDWTPSSMIHEIREKTVREIGAERAIFGFSGGVDSTTLAALLAPALGEQLLAVTIDGGQLRENELGEIRRHAEHAGAQLRTVDARSEFATVLAGITDAEEKRKRFKRLYVSLLQTVARQFAAKYVLQGTGGAKIKSHHNVGLDMGELVQLHPVDHLFKYEIRALAGDLGLPESVSKRQPFPGPGLFLRVVGTPATPEKLDVVRWADAQVREILIRHRLYDQISQLVVAYIGVDTVGVKGDGRVYKGSIAIRAIETADFMTAQGMWLPKEAVTEIKRIVTAHPEIVRVWFDPTDKPPATTEFE